MLNDAVQLRHREAQIEELTAYIRDPQWFGVRNHNNGDDVIVAGEDDDTSARRRWQGRSPANYNCSGDSGPKRQRAATGQLHAEFDVSARRRRNRTMCDGADGFPEVAVPPATEEVGASQRKVSHALHLTCFKTVTGFTSGKCRGCHQCQIWEMWQVSLISHLAGVTGVADVTPGIVACTTGVSPDRCDGCWLCHTWPLSLLSPTVTPGRQVSHALHLASTLILGLLVLEVRHYCYLLKIQVCIVNAIFYIRFIFLSATRLHYNFVVIQH